MISCEWNSRMELTMFQSLDSFMWFLSWVITGHVLTPQSDSKNAIPISRLQYQNRSVDTRTALLLYRFHVHSKMYWVLVYHALYVTQPLLPFPGKLQTSEEESVGKSVGKLATFWIGRAPWTELYYGTTHPLQSCQLPSTPRWRTLLTSVRGWAIRGCLSDTTLLNHK